MGNEILDEGFRTPVANNVSIREFAYPLQFEFKISSLANDFTATDANGLDRKSVV